MPGSAREGWMSTSPLRDAPGDPWPEHRIRARNLSRYSANKIHDDATARDYGYAGGLVAGTTVYAYMTAPLVAAWGLDWLARGSGRLSLVQPAYDGEELMAGTRVVARPGAETPLEAVAAA